MWVDATTSAPFTNNTLGSASSSEDGGTGAGEPAGGGVTGASSLSSKTKIQRSVTVTTSRLRFRAMLGSVGCVWAECQRFFHKNSTATALSCLHPSCAGKDRG